MNKDEGRGLIDKGPQQATIRVPVAHDVPQDGRCVRIGRDILEGRDAAARAELKDILNKPEKLRSLLNLRFARIVSMPDGRHAKMWMSMLVNVGGAAKSIDAGRMRHVIQVMGRIVDDLIRDESHAVFRQCADRHEALKMALSFKATFTRS